MAQNTVYNINKTFPIYNANGTSFHGLEIKKASVESVVMSLGDKISGDIYYNDSSLTFSLKEYIEYEGVKYVLVNPPTIVREGLVKDNGGLNGMTKYSLVFYHPMYMLGNFPFTDIAVTESEENYLAQNKTFSWIGNLFDFINKLNANLEDTEWMVTHNISQDGEEDAVERQKAQKLSDVLSFDNNFISDALKTAYDTWEIPFTITSEEQTISGVTKKFLIEFGLPSQEILDSDGQPYVFQFGQGVGLKNNSRTPKNNKIVTRIVGSGSERNIPFGYPQVPWYGVEGASYTYGNRVGVFNNVDVVVEGTTHHLDKLVSYPIYKGIYGGQWVELIKHPYTRKTLMPSVYAETVFNKISYINPDGSFNEKYNPDEVIIDFYDAVDTQEVQYPNPINPNAPSVEIHQFEDVYPRLQEDDGIVSATPYNDQKEELYVGKNVVTDMSLQQLYVLLDGFISSATNQNEASALYNLKNFIQNTPPQASTYHAWNNGGSYTFDCTASYTRDVYGLPIWHTKYTSDHVNFNINAYMYEPKPKWIDTMDDNGKYVQSYLKIKLPTLQFDLYACASITESMQINMRDGDCIGCTFDVLVDWEDYKKNFYDKDGNFAPNGTQRDMTKYPNSTTTQLELICHKDIDTFGTIMPNIYQNPKSGDKFVILGISLPQSYIKDAEKELDEVMMEYMLENNIHYFDYPLKFDEHFLVTHQDILAQIKNNNIVTFRYMGTDMKLYIKQITIKYGEGVLPQWDITLTDDVEIVLSKIGQVTDDVSRMQVQLSELQKYYSDNIISILEEKLSKVGDDVAQGRITFQQGLDAIGKVFLSDEIRSNDFSSGLGGRGWRIDQLGNAEVESLKVRSYLEVIELLINRIQAQEGDTLFTDNDQIDKVEKVGTEGNYSYILSLKEKYDGYFSPQIYGNILKGIINTLAAKQSGVSDESENNPNRQGTDDGGNKFYTSWMRVVDTYNTSQGTTYPLSKNQIRVVLFGNSDTPAGQNFEPCELMAIARWGCENFGGTQEERTKYAREGLNTDDAINASIERRQRLFYISNSDGRIAKLRAVSTPILRDYNYGTTLGILPDFIRTEWTAIQSRLLPNRDYLYAQGVIVGDFIKVDIQGQPIVTYVDCGEWGFGNTYLHEEYNQTNLQWETHDVWHNGLKWRCLQHQPVVDTVGGVTTTTYHEPKWQSEYWGVIEGDTNYTLQFVSSNGYSFRRTAVNTTITAHLFFGGIEITNEADVTPAKVIFTGWTRCLESNWNGGNPNFTQADIAWNNAHAKSNIYDPRTLVLTNEDMPVGWSSSDKTIFNCSVTIYDGNNTIIIENQIIS